MKTTLTLRHLRTISLIEGISYVLLLGIGMPLKYGFGIMLPNKILGMGHGIITILFCGVLLHIWNEKKLNNTWSIGVFIASLIPFGAFVMEMKLKQRDS